MNGAEELPLMSDQLWFSIKMRKMVLTWLAVVPVLGPSTPPASETFPASALLAASLSEVLPLDPPELGAPLVLAPLAAPLPLVAEPDPLLPACVPELDAPLAEPLEPPSGDDEDPDPHANNEVTPARASAWMAAGGFMRRSSARIETIGKTRGRLVA